MPIGGAEVAAIASGGAEVVTRLLRESVEAARNGAGVDEILMKLPVGIIREPSEFAETISKKAEYPKGAPICNEDELPGKAQNKSGETPPDGYAKMAGKAQNKSGETPPDGYAKMAGKAQNKSGETPINSDVGLADRLAFAVMRDIHQKDGLYPCYDKIIIASLHTPHGVFLGTNGIKRQPLQHMCPRKGLGINQGYGKCAEECRQPSHAELAALLKYKERVVEPDFENSQMTVYGAKEVCYHCKKAIELVGIQDIFIKPLEQLGELHDYQ